MTSTGVKKPVPYSMGHWLSLEQTKKLFRAWQTTEKQRAGLLEETRDGGSQGSTDSSTAKPTGDPAGGSRATQPTVSARLYGLLGFRISEDEVRREIERRRLEEYYDQLANPLLKRIKEDPDFQLAFEVARRTKAERQEDWEFEEDLEREGPEITKRLDDIEAKMNERSREVERKSRIQAEIDALRIEVSGARRDLASRLEARNAPQVLQVDVPPGYVCPACKHQIFDGYNHCPGCGDHIEWLDK